MDNSMAGLGLRSLYRNFVSTIGRQIFAALLQLAKVVIIARVYGPGGNGLLAIALLFPGMLAAFMNLGVSSANVYYLGSSQFSARRVLVSNLKLALGLSLLGLALGSFIVIFEADRFFPGVPHLMLWLALANFPVALLQNYISSIFQGLQQFGKYNFSLLVQPIITLLFVTILVAVGVEDLSWLIIANLAGIIIAVLISLALLRGHIPKDAGSDKTAYLKKAVGYGYKAHLSNILTFVNYRADLFLVNLLINPAAAGLYIIAIQLSERLWMLSQAVSTVLLPRLSELSKDETKRLQITPIITRLVLTVTIAGTAAFALLAYPLILFIFGDDYLQAFVPLLILLPGVAVFSASRVLANDIAARGKPELNMYLAFVTLTINISGNLLLIPIAGLRGAALATSIAYGFDVIARFFIYRRITKIDFSSFIFKRGDVKMLLELLNRKTYSWMHDKKS